MLNKHEIPSPVMTIPLCWLTQLWCTRQDGGCEEKKQVGLQLLIVLIEETEINSMGCELGGHNLGNRFYFFLESISSPRLSSRSSAPLPVSPSVSVL